MDQKYLELKEALIILGKLFTTRNKSIDDRTAFVNQQNRIIKLEDELLIHEKTT